MANTFITVSDDGVGTLFTTTNFPSTPPIPKFSSVIPATPAPITLESFIPPTPLPGGLGGPVGTPIDSG